MPSSADPLKFSIVTVTKNAAAHLAACLESVAGQTYPHVEHVLIDGASTDQTLEIARARLSARDQLHSEPDSGIYDGMNKGIARARGDYLLFLGADDVLLDRDVIADVAAFISSAGAPDMIYGDLEVRDTQGGRSVFRAPEPEAALDLMVCGCLPHQATFAHRTLFARIGCFDLRYRVQADYDWFLRALGDKGASIRHMRRVVSSFALGGASSRLQAGQDETYAIQNAFPLYCEPEWMQKRLEAFQREVLTLRLQAQGAPPRALGPRLKRAAQRVLKKFVLPPAKL